MKSSKTQQKNKDENPLGQIVGKYVSYWPLFLVFTILSMVGAILMLRYTVPMYEANATLIIKDEKKGIEDSRQMDEMNIISTKTISENEVEVLQSRNIIDNVVKALHLYAPLKQEGKISTLSAYVSSPITIEAKYPDSINFLPKEDAKIFYTFSTTNQKVFLNNKLSYPLNEWVKTNYGILKFSPNPRYRPSTNNKPFFFTLYPVKIATMGVTGSLKVSPSGKLSSTINLSCKDEVPEKAEDILNQLIRFYNLAAVNEKSTLVTNTLRSIEERLAEVSSDLDSIERKKQQFKSGSNAVELNQQGVSYLQQVGVNDAELGRVNVQLSTLEKVEKTIENSESGGGILPVGINDPGLTQLMNNLNNLQMERDRLKKTVAENNPILLSLNEQIGKIKPNIIANIQTQRNNLQLSRNNLAATTGKYSSMLSYIPQKEKELLEISRDELTKRAIYDFLLRKREESKLSYSTAISDSRVISYAQSSGSPVSPKKIIFYVGAILIGLVIPIVLINGSELLNNKILYRKEIENATSIPVIGELAYNKSNNALVLEEGKRTFIAEEFRKLRISLLYLGIDAIHKKKILVTSSIPGEGKSFIASNLAISLAMTGKKVILVDLDLHNPSMGKIFGKQNDKGVSDYLIGEKEIHEIITYTNTKNLSFIACGTLQEAPSELLVNGKVQTLINFLERIYDLVIIDTAPTIYVTDAYTLTNLTDATLYVVRHNHTPKLILKRMDENTQINPLNNPAILFNGVKTRGFFKNNYGYGYDYVYGKDNKKKKKEASS